MATIEITQYSDTTHIPKQRFRDIIVNEDLSKEELRVFMYLVTILNGYNYERRKTQRNNKDPLNFLTVSPSVISEELLIKKKKVKAAIDRLELLGILEKGMSSSAKDGYRFTF